MKKIPGNNKLLSLSLSIGLLGVVCYCFAQHLPFHREEIIHVKGHEMVIESKESQRAGMLNDALLAEMALARNQPFLAEKYYKRLLSQTLDAEVAKRATLLALTIGQPNDALALAKIWAEEDKNDLTAQQVYANLLIHTDNAKQALPSIKKLISHDAANDDLRLFLTTLASTPEPLRAKFLKHLATLQPDNDPNGYFNLAFIYNETGQLDAGLSAIDKAIALQSPWPLATALKTQLIFSKGQQQRAFDYLNETIALYPSEPSLLFMKAKLLQHTNSPEEAINTLKQLQNNAEFRGQALMQIAEIYINQQQWKKAKDTLKKAQKLKDYTAISNYLLGEIAEFEGNYQEAIEWFEKVNSQTYDVPAQIKVAMILARTGQLQKAQAYLSNIPSQSFEQSKQILLIETQFLMQAQQQDEALRKLSVALDIIPNDLQLLYARGLVAQQLGQYQLLEQDLRKIITIDQNQARALNILGYLLTVQKKDYNEALGYIQQALKLEPENPAILDSMGWVLFQLGRNKEAISYLERAYALSPDPEIAAHLGEVLWSTGKKKSAKAIWRKSLEQYPTDASLMETLERLKVNKGSL